MTSLIIVSAPSGAGKSSLCNRALKEFPTLVHSISYTTRTPRPRESDGDHYFFITEQKFLSLIEKGFFAEWAKVHSHYYGTSKEQLESAWEKGQTVIMDIDVQGASQLKEQYPFAHTVFILPPSIDELKKRLQKRDAKTSFLNLRLKNAEEEMKMADQYDHQIINDNFETSYAQFRKIIEDIITSSYKKTKLDSNINKKINENDEVRKKG